MREMVENYEKSCPVCQLVGKSAHNLPPAPLNPIPVESEPFSRLVIDSVGPLPKTKQGNQFLFTIMDTVTRHSEAIPLRKINARLILWALIKLFSHVGFPREIQSDQETSRHQVSTNTAQLNPVKSTTYAENSQPRTSIQTMLQAPAANPPY